MTKHHSDAEPINITLTEYWYHWQQETLILDIHLQPRASRDEIVGGHGGRLKIRLTAPPADGKANRSLLKFIAKLCGVPVRQTCLLNGKTSRDKRVTIESPRCLPEGVQRPKL